METPEATYGFTIGKLRLGNLFGILYFPPGGPQPWRPNENQTMHRTNDGAVFLFENHEPDPWIQRRVEEYKEQGRAEEAAARLRIHQG